MPICKPVPWFHIILLHKIAVILLYWQILNHTKHMIHTNQYSLSKRLLCQVLGLFNIHVSPIQLVSHCANRKENSSIHFNIRFWTCKFTHAVSAICFMGDSSANYCPYYIMCNETPHAFSYTCHEFIVPNSRYMYPLCLIGKYFITPKNENRLTLQIFQSVFDIVRETVKKKILIYSPRFSPPLLLSCCGSKHS